jgi:hypothetical protein
MGLEIKKLIFASGLVTAISIVLIVISLILQLLLLIAPSDTSSTIDLANTIYAFLLYPLMFSLYLWAGVRAVRKYNFDAIGAGMVAAFSYFLSGLAQLALSIVLSIIVLSRFSGSGGFSTPESVLAGAIFEDVMGMKGVGLSAICGIGILLFGTVINFVVGGFGGIFALSSSRRDSYD